MLKTKIQLHFGLAQEDYDRIRNKEAAQLTDDALQEYLEGFNEELDKDADDYPLQLVKMAYLQGFYQGITSFDKISITANYDQDYVGEE